ncbi:succinylglutamate desuccinylase [Paraburkholderia sp. Tr-20389]|uniref:succinylglutamate desuccinylase/aspartoacylase family protein n=1 Tax=Paraburkholderia sp. Tr-20389 TaxID=2703903 RepID=UPI001980AE9B|nr:succinylglutamate desuccinylase/aspartoacylase family protein [Paraburkholderia sp. Tr-20389]MBN3753272.1 succinylglutamate desuccinylase [Paraburkholderia sp. Tr-20389]
MTIINFNEFDLNQFPVGRTSKGYFVVDDDMRHPIPFFVIRSEVPGPVLTVTGGVHASEYTGIEAVVRLSRDADRLRSGTLIVMPVVNTAGFKKRSVSENPVDGKNLNRLFPGSPDGSASDRLAHALFSKVISISDAYIDVHSGDIGEALTPFTFFDAGNEASRVLAAVFGLPYIVGAPRDGFSCRASSSIDVPGILVEAGHSGSVDDACVQQLTDGIHRVMVHLGMCGEAMPASQIPRELSLRTLTSELDGLWYPQIQPGMKVSRGTAVGRLDTLLCDGGYVPLAKDEGIVLFFVNTLAINKGDVVCAVGVDADR